MATFAAGLACHADETMFFGVQSKGFSKRWPVPLGLDLGALRSDWWVITIHANSDSSVCYVLHITDVRNLASQDKNGGRWWLEPKVYDRDEFREAWHRLESPRPVAGPASMPL